MALDAHIVWEMRDSASNNNGGGTRWVSLVNSTYKWTASGSGTNEYHVELAGGGDPGLTEAKAVTTDGSYVSDTNGVMGSLNAGEWDWGDNDALGYSTVYVRLDDGADPDTKNDKWVSMIFNGGTDLTLQDASAHGDTDLACADHVTFNCTSAGSTFDANVNGSLIYIRDTGALGRFTVGWYECTFVDANTISLDRDPTDGNDETAGDFEIGGARALPVDAHFEAWTAGNKMYMEDGTYTLTGAISVSVAGLETDMDVVEGYGTTRGDAPTGASRPLIAAAANALQFGNQWRLKHIDCTTTETNGFRAGSDSQFQNCKSYNSGAATRSAFYVTYRGVFYDCEGQSDNGNAFRAGNDGPRLFYSYAHDSVTGVLGEPNIISYFSIFDTCSTVGIQSGSGEDKHLIIHNTIYNCGIGIDIDDGNNCIILNNQITSNTTGLNSDTADISNSWLVDYNNYNGNTTDVSGVSKGPNATANAPGFANAAGGDFSGVDDADGYGIRLGVGA